MAATSVAASFLFLSCSGSEETVPDPSGEVLASENDWICDETEV